MRNLSPHTQTSYVQQVSRFARHFGRSPDTLGPEEIRAYQLHLTNDRKLAPGSICIAVSALRFLYTVTLKTVWPVGAVIPAPKQPQTLPVVLSPEEVVQFLACVKHPKHRTILTTCYAAGLRISEAVRLTAPASTSTASGMRVISPTSPAPTLNSTGRLSHRLLAQGGQPLPECVVFADAGRLSLYGRGAERLHEELAPVTARWIEPSGRSAPLQAYARAAEARTLELLERSLGGGGSEPGEVIGEKQLRRLQRQSRVEQARRLSGEVFLDHPLHGDAGVDDVTVHVA